MYPEKRNGLRLIPHNLLQPKQPRIHWFCYNRYNLCYDLKRDKKAVFIGFVTTVTT